MPVTPVRVPDFKIRKRRGEKIAMLTITIRCLAFALTIGRHLGLHDELSFFGRQKRRCAQFVD